MKLFFQSLLFLGLSISSYAQVTPQEKIDAFLAAFEPASTDVFCRTDIKTPECRTVIRYKSKADGKLSPSFQITFSAPFRQAGGAEFFLSNGEPYHSYTRLSDGTVDGKVNVALESEDQRIYISKQGIRIKDIKFGTLIADLTFSRKSAELAGMNNGQPVKISYPHFEARK